MAATSGSAAQGFMLLFAKVASPKCLFFSRGRPLPVIDSIAGPLWAEGPFLILLRCVLAPNGKAMAIEGAAQPIEGSGSFMPAKSTFERDILCELRALQISLDHHGIDCSVTRPFDKDQGIFAPCLLLETHRNGYSWKPLHIDLPGNNIQFPPAYTSGQHFELSASRLVDGSVISWIAGALGFSPRKRTRDAKVGPPLRQSGRSEHGMA